MGKVIITGWHVFFSIMIPAWITAFIDNYHNNWGLFLAVLAALGSLVGLGRLAIKLVSEFIDLQDKFSNHKYRPFLLHLVLGITAIMVLFILIMAYIYNR